MSAYLKAAVASPVGFADLRQAILADAFRGKRARLSGELKTAGVGQNASLYLRVIDPGRTKPPEDRQEIAVRGTREWMRYETTVEVPAESVFILFGISLTGPGQVWVTDAQLDAV